MSALRTIVALALVSVSTGVLGCHPAAHDTTAPSAGAASTAPATSAPASMAAMPATSAPASSAAASGAAAASAPCITLDDADRMAAADKGTGPRKKGEFRYSGLKCAEGWATVVSSSVKDKNVDAMVIVFHFVDGKWTIVTYGSSVEDAIPENLRKALAQ